MNGERTDRKRNGRVVPFYPLLLAVTPILFVYTYNGAKIPIGLRELLPPVVLSLAVTAVLWMVLGLLFRGATRSALVVSLFLVLFYSYGHVAGALGSGRQTWTDLLLFWGLVMAAGTWLVVRRFGPAVQRAQFGLTVLLNSISVATLAVCLANGAQALPHRPPRPERAPGRAVAATGGDYPDIYYIITDAYARSDVLKSHYHTDNSAFLAELSRLGFFIADRSQSNYVQTYLSLASSLNFTYLDSLSEALGPESDSRGPLIRMIQNSRLVDFLRRRGYTVASFASGFTGTDLIGADVHFAPGWSLSEFQSLLVNTTLLRDVLGLLGTSPVVLHRDRVLYTLREMPNAGVGRRPVFVLAHILSPHPPFVFGADGEWPAIPRSLGVDRTQPWLNQPVCKTIDFKWYDGYYGPQVRYLNTLLTDAVRRILAQSARPPIIVIHADHGPGSVFRWRDLTRRQVQEQTAIFYAVYMPPSGRPTQPPAELYDSITPVNTFRVILSQFFDTTMALLPDRSYFSIWGRPYRFYDANRPESYPIGGVTASPE